MISVSNVTKRYLGDKPAIASCNFTVGETGIAVLGDDGAGKTTLGKMLCGLIPPSEGAITVDGMKSTDRAASALIGYMPAVCSLDRSLTAWESLDFVAKLRNLKHEDLQQALDVAGLDRRQADLPVGALSEEQKKRASIALAVLGEPKYLVLDQPLSALSPDEADVICELLYDLSERYTLIYLTDSPDEAQKFCREVLLLSLGNTVAHGDCDEVFNRESGKDDYKARVRGDREKILSALSEHSEITHHKVSITSSGTAIIEVTVSGNGDAAKLLYGIFDDAECRVLELKKAESPIERALSQLYKKQEEKQERLREEQAEKPELVKLDASTIAFRHSDEDEEETDGEDEVEDKFAEKPKGSRSSRGADSEGNSHQAAQKKSNSLLRFHHIDDSDQDNDGEDNGDGESTLFSSSEDKY